MQDRPFTDRKESRPLFSSFGYSTPSSACKEDEAADEVLEQFSSFNSFSFEPPKPQQPSNSERTIALISHSLSTKKKTIDQQVAVHDTEISASKKPMSFDLLDDSDEDRKIRHHKGKDSREKDNRQRKKSKKSGKLKKSSPLSASPVTFTNDLNNKLKVLEIERTRARALPSTARLPPSELPVGKTRKPDITDAESLYLFDTRGSRDNLVYCSSVSDGPSFKRIRSQVLGTTGEERIIFNKVNRYFVSVKLLDSDSTNSSSTLNAPMRYYGLDWRRAFHRTHPSRIVPLQQLQSRRLNFEQDLIVKRKSRLLKDQMAFDEQMAKEPLFSRLHFSAKDEPNLESRITDDLDPEEDVNRNKKEKNDHNSQEEEEELFIPFFYDADSQADEDDEKPADDHQLQLEKNLMMKTKDIIEKVQADPHNISLWLDYVDLQEEFSFLPGFSKTSAFGDKIFITERKIKIFADALEKNPDNKQLLDSYLDLCERVRDSTQTCDIYQRILESQQLRSVFDRTIWQRYLNFQLRNFKTFSATASRQLFVSVLKAISKCRKKPEDYSVDPENVVQSLFDLECQALEFLQQMLTLEKQLGFIERAIGIYQALIEFSFFSPSIFLRSSYQEKLVSFRAFWNSEKPRFAEKHAKGWASWAELAERSFSIPSEQQDSISADHDHDESNNKHDVEQEKREKEQLLESLQSEPPLIAFQRIQETLYWLPARTRDFSSNRLSDQERSQVVDVDRVVLFEDVKDFLFPLYSSESKFRLLYHFFSFLLSCVGPEGPVSNCFVPSDLFSLLPVSSSSWEMESRSLEVDSVGPFFPFSKNSLHLPLRFRLDSSALSLTFLRHFSTFVK